VASRNFIGFLSCGGAPYSGLFLAGTNIHRLRLGSSISQRWMYVVRRNGVLTRVIVFPIIKGVRVKGCIMECEWEAQDLLLLTS
jgi:hypothetical protein